MSSQLFLSVLFVMWPRKPELGFLGFIVQHHFMALVSWTLFKPLPSSPVKAIKIWPSAMKINDDLCF